MFRVLTTSIVVLVLPIGTLAADPRPLGWLSAEWEAKTAGPLAYNPGAGDAGGPSYGTFQLASKRGVDGSSALAFAKTYYPNDFLDPEAKAKGEVRYLDPDTDTAKFRAKYAEVAQREGDRFKNNEREFIYDTHYEPLVRLIKEKTGLDIEARGDALRNVAWSVAVQHGNPVVDPKHATGLKLFERALEKWTREQLAKPRGTTGSVDEGALIDAIYEERGRKDKGGKLVYFPHNDQKSTEALSKRFKRERSEASSAQSREPLAPDLNDTALGKLAKANGIVAAPVRRPNPNLLVARGQPTFDFSNIGTHPANGLRASVPNNASGVRLGRGYDLGRVTKGQAEKDLKAAGFSDSQVNVYAGAAGLTGEKARAYLKGFNYSRLSAKARAMGLTGAAVNKYIKENSPQPIEYEAQKKLFEIAYDRAEKEAAGQFPGFESFPDPVKSALLDMVYDRGTAALVKEQPRFLEAVRDRKWDEAAILSKRNGAGFERNKWTKDLLRQAVAPMPRPQ